MATITKAQLATRVLKLLGVVAAEEAPTAEDSTLVQEYIDAVYGELDQFGTVSFATSAVPEWAQEPLRDRVAFAVAEEFGLAPARIGELKARAAEALTLLLRHMSALGETNTRLELRNSVLTMLGLLKQGEAAPAAMSETALDVIDSTFDWLDERFTLGFTSATIPEWARTLLRDLVAPRAAKELGIADSGAWAEAAAIADAEIAKRVTALGEVNTKNLLRNMVLQHLGVIGIAEKASAAQKEYVENAIDYTFEQLKVHNVVTFTTTTIPSWAMIPLRNYVAAEVATAFARQPDYGKAQEAWRELKKQQSTQQINEPIEATYF